MPSCTQIRHVQLLFKFVHKMATGGHFGWPKITRSHLSSFQINTQHFFLIFFTNWPPAAILDDRKSLSIALLAILDQYTTFNFFEFCSQNGRRRPFWMTKNHFQSHFSSFQINTQLYFYNIAAGGHFRWPKITFYYFSRHFRSIRNFIYKMATCGYFGWPKITFDHFSRHFRSMRNF